MAEFQPAVEKLLKIEGGYAKRDNNNGSVNFGITAKFLREIGSALTPETLTRPQAIDVYRRYFWDAFKCGDLSSQALAEALLIEVVNTPPKITVKALQTAIAQALRLRGGLAPTPDGLMGRMTVTMCNVADPASVLAGFKANMLTYYEHLAAANPQLYADDLPGWRERLKTL